MQNIHTKKPSCRRCGDCCQNGGPALHEEDMPLIQDGSIPLTSIVTLRPGERAYDQPAQKVLPLDAEILKIKGRDGKWTCGKSGQSVPVGVGMPTVKLSHITVGGTENG